MKILAQYEYRANVFQHAKTYTLTPDAIVVRKGATGRERIIPLAEFAKLDMLMRASPAYGAAHVCRLWRKNALFPALGIASKSFRAFNDFETKDGAYANFVTKLHAALAAQGAPRRYEITVPESAILYALLEQGHIALIVLAVVFILAVLASGEIDVAVAITIAAALALVWFALARLKKMGPWPYDPAAIPEGALPKSGIEQT